MNWQTTSRAFLLCLFLLPVGLMAQEVNGSIEAEEPEDTVQVLAPGEKPKPTKYIPTEEDMKQTFFQGFSVSTDVLNMALYFLSNYGNLEASLRLNLLNTYFPIAELGLGRCNNTDLTTKINYSTNAPYLKIGIDYNLLRNKWQTNKLYFGLRYGITNYNYTITGLPQTDPIWHETGPIDIKSKNATSHYLEVVFGCQVKIWSFIHMGWSARYKSELHTTKSLYAHPYYIPGYGTTVGSSLWAATYNISFDLNWGKKKPTAKQVIENTVNEINQSSQPLEPNVPKAEEHRNKQ